MAGARELKKSKKTKKNGKKNSALFVAAGLAAVALAGYLGLCVWAGGGKILPNVSVGGVDVSGMDQAAAQEKVLSALEEQSAQLSVKLEYGAWSGVMDCSGCWPASEESVQQAMAVGRGSFLTRGGAYLSHLLGKGTDIKLTAQMSQEAEGQLEQLLDEADRAVGGDVTGASYRAEDDKLVITKGVTGVAIDREQTRELVAQALGRALEEGLDSGARQETITLSAQEEAPRDPDFDQIWEEVHVEAQDACLDPETYEIKAHVVGVDFDRQAAKSSYDQAGEGETITIALTITQPKVTQQSLKANLFTDLLGEGTSKVGGSSNRKFNVKLSAEACNGVILLPGEEFSYNNTTGSRSASKGYLPAPVYSGGLSVDEVGGGICQTSSTIYLAVLHTTLEVVERHDHQFAPGYVQDGMDATVYYGSLDFRFKNNTDYPIKIVTSSYDKNGGRYLNVKIYGTNVDGRYGVPERIQYDFVEPTTKYVADETVPQGTTREDTKQNPYQGRSAHTYRYIYEKDGTLVEKQDMGVSKYDMRPRTVYYNPLDGDPSTWENGAPPKAETQPDPGTATDPGSTADPGSTGDPGTADPGTADPGTAADPGSTTDPAAETQPDPSTQTEPPQYAGVPLDPVESEAAEQA